MTTPTSQTHETGSMAQAIGWMIGVTLAFFGFGFMLHSLWDADIAMSGLMVLAAIVLVSFAGPRRRHEGRSRFLPPLVLIPALMFAFWHFITIKFGHFGFGPILFHAQYGVEANGIVGEFLHSSRVPLLFIAALVAGLWLISATDYRFRRIDRFAVLPLLVANPFTVSAFEYVGIARASPDWSIAERFVESEALEQTGEAAPNLLHIILESSEHTLYDRSDFGDVMDPLIPFAERGLQLTGVQQAALTGWSLAGDLASHCGVPLLPLGLVSYNSFHVIERGFMSGAACLGGLLRRDGYNTSVMHTSPLQFAGADKLYSSHGWDHLLGLPELRPHYPVGGNAWGLDDEDLYDAVYERVAKLSAGSEPFAIVMANAGGHAPKGFVSRSCRGRPTVERLDDPSLQAYRCTHELAAAMLARLEAGGYLDNTIVVVQSDHLAMRNTIYAKLERHERRNLFFAFGSGIAPQVIDRDMTMMDIYPTLLDLMGYAPPNGRAGIGVSAFAAGPTLTEEHGLRALDKAIYGDTVLRNRLWAIEAGS
ncbi:MAG: sulfatase-like hydrolase/transferase [Phyllobacteriaceae bacterium]|nr:sulfatase-like hydrolase/transferase [Phyllobacteriaceae bacterium]